MPTQSPGIDTNALHAGQVPDRETGSRAVPIYQTTSFVFEDTDHAAELFALQRLGNIYTRLMNPTTDVLEKRLAALHGATGGLATASGMAAIFYAVTNITKAGQNIVASPNLYGGTVTLFQHTLPRFGIETRFVDLADPANLADAIDENTRLVYAETIGNPRCNIDPLDELADQAHRHGVPLVVDNTFAPPPIFNPFEHGADIVVYSLTKMIGGHGTSIGGALIENGRFDWTAQARYPEITEPQPAYHDANLYQVFGNHDQAPLPGMAFVARARTCLLRDTGACMSPFNAFLFLQGVETLPLRARRHCENARAIAHYLSEHKNVVWVNHPSLASHPNHARANRYMPLGPGAVFSFGIRGGLEAGKRFIESVKLCSHLANVLDAKTLVIHPASTTHQQLTPEDQETAGVTPDSIRISVGLEDVADIQADLDQALNAASA